MSELGGTFRGVTRDRIAFVCSACGQRLSQWTGRCPGCAAWGTVDQTAGAAAGRGRDAARATLPAVLAVDSIQTLRDPQGTAMPGGVTQVRLCADALVGLAKSEGITVILTGHVTKHGDLAGPRALEHAVDVVLAFEGDSRSGLRVLSGGKNRFGAEGETAWLEMGPHGLDRIDPTAMLVPGESAPGSAVAVVPAGRRALAGEVQALVGS